MQGNNTSKPCGPLTSAGSFVTWVNTIPIRKIFIAGRMETTPASRTAAMMKESRSDILTSNRV